MAKTIGIIGAGIAGISAAYYLAKAGHKVTVYDQEPHSAMRCSYANGGQLSVSNSETWHSWSNVVKGIKWLTKKDAPLLIRPGFDIDRIKWLIRFLKNTYIGIRQDNTIKTILMGLEARKLYLEIAEQENIDFDLSKSGILHFYKDEKYFQAAKNNQRLFEDAGCEWKILTSDEVFQREPSLYRDSTLLGGVWTEDDMMGDIHKFCHNLSTVLKVKYKVDFVYGKLVRPSDIHEMKSYHDRIVISAGAESVKFAKEFKDDCSIYPVKGYSITITDNNANLPTVSLLDDQAKIVTSTFGNRFRVAGTAELTGFNYDIRKDRIDPLLYWVRTTFPQISTKDYSSWACLRPMTADMMPMIARSKVKNVYYHTGHGHLGWTLSPATAKQLTTLMNED